MRLLTEEIMKNFKRQLYKDEKRMATIEKYLRDIQKLQEFLQNEEISKEKMIAYKEYLQNCGKYKTRSINSFLAAANHLLEKTGWGECRVKMIKVQTEIFRPEDKELSMQEYQRLIHTAMKLGNERMAILMQTVCSTGIRISELKYITVESLKHGMTEIYNKGKVRKVIYPSRLQKILKNYSRKNHIKEGSIFRSGSGRNLNRSNIWRDMKKISSQAGINPGKVFPHNLRHLFAHCFYQINKDIAKLADILGHSNIETTRIYIQSTGKEHKKQLDNMKLVVTQIHRQNKKKE